MKLTDRLMTEELRSPREALRDAIFSVFGWRSRYNPERRWTLENQDASTFDPLPDGILSGDEDNPEWMKATDAILAALSGFTLVPEGTVGALGGALDRMIRAMGRTLDGRYIGRTVDFDATVNEALGILIDTAPAAATERERILKDAARGARLVRIAEGFLEQYGSRTSDGRAITAEWGEPDEFGVYEPTFTSTNDGWVERIAAEERAEIRAVVEQKREVEGTTEPHAGRVRAWNRAMDAVRILLDSRSAAGPK